MRGELDWQDDASPHHRLPVECNNDEREVTPSRQNITLDHVATLFAIPRYRRGGKGIEEEGQNVNPLPPENLRGRVKGTRRLAAGGTGEQTITPRKFCDWRLDRVKAPGDCKGREP